MRGRAASARAQRSLGMTVTPGRVRRRCHPRAQTRVMRVTLARTLLAASPLTIRRTVTQTPLTTSLTIRYDYITATIDICYIDCLQVPRSTCRPITPQKPPRKSKQSGDELETRSQSQPALGNSSNRERSSSAASVPSLSQKNFKVITHGQ